MEGTVYCQGQTAARLHQNPTPSCTCIFLLTSLLAFFFTQTEALELNYSTVSVNLAVLSGAHNCEVRSPLNAEVCTPLASVPWLSAG